MLYNMRQVEIDALNVRILGSDSFKCIAKATTDIDQLLYVLETIVSLKNFLDDQSRKVVHRCIENFIEPGVQSRVLKSARSMDTIKWNSSFNNSFF